MVDQATGLIKLGHKVELFYPNFGLNQLVEVPNEIKINSENFQERLEDYKSAHSIYKNQKDVIGLSSLLELYQINISREINKHFDILLVHPCIFFRTSSIGKFVKIPKILYLQEPYRWFYESLPYLPLIFTEEMLNNNLDLIMGIKFQARLENQNVKLYDIVLCNSYYSLESITRVYGINSKVSYLGIDINLFPFSEYPRENYIIGLGTIYHAKGIDRAIKAISILDYKNRPKLIWIGNGSFNKDKEIYEDLARKLNVNIEFKVNISNEEVIFYLHRAKLLIYTSRLEPFGYAPLEASSCGTPVVGVPEGGIRETVKDGINGFLSESNDSIDIANKIKKILEMNEMEYKNISVSSRKYIEEFWAISKSINNLEKTIYNLIQSIKNSKNN